jgi:hypothetical protein
LLPTARPIAQLAHGALGKLNKIDVGRETRQ